MTILTDISEPEKVNAVTVRCDACGTTAEFVIKKPSDLILGMAVLGWAVPVEGLGDYCQDCKMRHSNR